MPDRMLKHIQKNRDHFSYSNEPFLELLLLSLAVLEEGLGKYQHHLYYRKDVAQIALARKLIEFALSDYDLPSYVAFRKQRRLEGCPGILGEEFEKIESGEAFRLMQVPFTPRSEALRDRWLKDLKKDEHKKKKALSDAMKIIGRHAWSWWD